MKCLIVVFYYFCLVRLLTLSQVTEENKLKCSEDEFDCEIFFSPEKQCVPLNSTCNGKGDCSNFRDEDHALCKDKICSINEFKCSYGACIPLKAVCNSKIDCFDTSDEKNCETFNKPTNQCNKKLISCLTTDECISPILKCDGTADCSDNSDETSVACGDIICPENTFRCNYGACIDSSLVCDGKPDCADYSDEMQPYCKRKLNATSENVCRSSASFKCGSNMCIDKSKVCDGIRHCDDGLDETSVLCENTACNFKTHFQCYYGACISKDNLTCNHCADNTFIPCMNGRPYFTGSPGGTSGSGSAFAGGYAPIGENEHLEPKCYYPLIPSNGNYSVATGIPFTPGTIAPQWTILQYTCNEGYVLNGDAVLVCLGTDWNHQPPSCLKKCPPLISKNHEVECLEYEHGRNISCDQGYEGTIANIKCKDSFEISSAIYQPYNAIQCRNGSWSHELFDCEPKCGSITPKAVPLVIQGYKATKGDYPWHAGIYKREYSDVKQICGGTLISEKIVISAAHCFWDWQKNKANVNQEDYLVAVGKYHRTWNSTKDQFAQYSCIDRIYIPSKFRADQSSYSNDIAVLILNETLELSTFVLPICVDWGNNLYKQLLKGGNYGVVVGWGLTEEFGDASEELQVAHMPFVPYDECFHLSPPEFRPFITEDKICAGYKNGTSVCTGDSGGGLAFKKRNRFFLEGIVSVSPGKYNTCDSSTFAAFTSIPKHLSLIKKIESDVTNSV